MSGRHRVWNAGTNRQIFWLHLGGQTGHLPLAAKSSANWKELYIAALFERDKSKFAAKLADAQKAISTERRKLLTSARDLSDVVAQERQALDNALFSLQALAGCMAIPPTAVSGATPEVRVA
jgi:hypothetical protein